MLITITLPPRRLRKSTIEWLNHEGENRFVRDGNKQYRDMTFVQVAWYWIGALARWRSP